MRILSLGLAFALALFAAPMPTQAIEEPAYEVTRMIGELEVRQYAPYVVAEVVIAESATAAGNTGFRILADYIFGKNKGERKLAMTAPVTQSPESRSTPGITHRSHPGFCVATSIG